MNLSNDATNHLNQGNLDACLATVHSELRDQPASPLQAAIDLDYTNDPSSIGRTLAAFISENQWRAVYIEYDYHGGFGIFGFHRCGDKQLAWIGDFDDDVDGESLHGMAAIESICYPSDYQSLDHEKSCELSSSLLILKFYRLIKRSLASIPDVNIPIIVSSHDDAYPLILGDDSIMLTYDKDDHDEKQIEIDNRDELREQAKKENIRMFHADLTTQDVFIFCSLNESISFSSSTITPDVFIQGRCVQEVLTNPSGLTHDARIPQAMPSYLRLHWAAQKETNEITHVLNGSFLDDNLFEFKIPIISTSLATILTAVCPDDIELIPVCWNNDSEDQPTSHYLLNITATIQSAINPDLSAIKWRSSRPPWTQNSASHYFPLVLRPNSMGHHHIGRFYEDMRKIFISNALANQLFAFERAQGIDRFSCSTPLFRRLDDDINYRYMNEMNRLPNQSSIPSWAR
jgi:hypothetical protein